MAKWTKADGVKLGHLLEDWKTFDRKPGKERIHLRGDVVESILKSKGQQALLTKLRDVVGLPLGRDWVFSAVANYKCLQCKENIRLRKEGVLCRSCTRKPGGKEFKYGVSGDRARSTWSTWSSEAKKRKHDGYRQTCIERYGVDNVWKADEVKAKIKTTTLANGGYTSSRPSAQAKVRETSLRRYGVPHFRKSPDIIYASRKAFVTNGSDGKKRTYSGTLNGRPIEYQGYELAAAEIIERAVGTGSVETQFDMDTSFRLPDGHWCFFDLYIRKLNTFVEVKSLWTFMTVRPTSLARAKYEQRCANDAGIKLRYIVIYRTPKNIAYAVLPPTWYLWSRRAITKHLVSKGVIA